MMEQNIDADIGWWAGPVGDWVYWLKQELIQDPDIVQRVEQEN